MLKIFKNILAYLLVGLFLAQAPNLAFANPIDDKCPALTYRSAPKVLADQYMCRTQYAVAFSYTTKNPMYTTEFLTKLHTGNLPRTNDFRPDTDVPAKYQVKPSDYTNTICNGGRCDRGHMTPDQDFSACAICVSESFLMTNMVPQNFQNNEIIWKYMETKIRKYVAGGNDVYIITGPIYTPGKEVYIGKIQVRVPDKLFKVVIDAKTGKSVAFIMSNTDLPVAELEHYADSLGAVEKATGILFDVSLDKSTIGTLDILR